jgi:hypothetical protein
MSEYTIRPLGPDTWDAFAELAGRHKGAGFGCWCTWFHPLRTDHDSDVEPGRPYKERMVREGRAHAALAFDGDVAVAWCQYGTPEELPRIFHRKEYEAGADGRPDYRVTCIFVDRRYRRAGMSAVALRGALHLIGQAGGGLVEAYPQDTGGKKISATFLYSATRSLFEQEGFRYDRPKGKNHCVMSKTVASEPCR